MKAARPAPRSSLPAALIALYRATEYRATLAGPPGGGSLILRIDEYCAPLSRLLAASGCQCAAFITAWNPRGARLDPAENRSAARRLRRRLARFVPAGHIFKGAGCDPSGVWPAEASLLMLGLGLEMAQALGREFRQNAIVWAGPDAIPRLILLR